ncbi:MULTISPECIES: acyl-CoA dehydrogenase family protein [unclassified Chelatococcus]|uniref:acyl-CoA dehydrogenase family protein n=1 Tax=unclassified Chelatococcus TaxID=2638111 RepID=UPI001BCD187A|nr:MULTISPECIES: acyl-CoA dehydrogenase family protein [unclassified Chelatococcus]MBS7700170.1 acyl-CoA dehydrogenase family protein [Chelatococcus sp. YT9]MBX3556863.1 acyl-CoA dehydrogenase family protein [Chelatococcus sp.]
MPSETHGELREPLRRFVRERLVPLEAQVAQDDRLPDEIVREMRDMGLFGLTIPEEFGGMGLPVAEEIELVFELTWASLAFRSIIAMNLGVGSQGIVADGTPEQKATWLPRIASGEVITSFCLTEPDSGSDSAALRTTALRDGDDYVISGTKRFISNAPLAGLFIVMARTSPEKLPGNRHVTTFLVPAATPGLSVGKKDRKMGQRGAATADVILDGVRVPASSILGGEVGRGFSTAMKVLDRGRIGVAAAAIGQARRLLHEALTYAIERKQFGRAIGEFQLVQAMLADSRAELYAAESMVRDAARRLDGGENVSLEASCCKMFATEMVGRVADRTIQIFGGAGYMEESGVERFYRDVRVLRIYEGTTQIQQLVIARNMLREAGHAC